jgi:minimal PKS acyl carrier protein
MSELTMADLALLMRRVAGEDEALDLETAAENADFGDLGYDSLALLETAREVEREYGVTLTDDVVAASTNPREFLALVNQTLATSAASVKPWKLG